MSLDKLGKEHRKGKTLFELKNKHSTGIQGKKGKINSHNT